MYYIGAGEGLRPLRTPSSLRHVPPPRSPSRLSRESYEISAFLFGPRGRVGTRKIALGLSSTAFGDKFLEKVFSYSSTGTLLWATMPNIP